jgi:hypothetical protein
MIKNCAHNESYPYFSPVCDGEKLSSLYEERVYGVKKCPSLNFLPTHGINSPFACGHELRLVLAPPTVKALQHCKVFFRCFFYSSYVVCVTVGDSVCVGKKKLKCTRSLTHVQMHTCTERARAHTRTHAHTHTHKYTHTPRTHTHTHTHTHT